MRLLDWTKQSFFDCQKRRNSKGKWLDTLWKQLIQLELVILLLVHFLSHWEKMAPYSMYVQLRRHFQVFRLGIWVEFLWCLCNECCRMKGSLRKLLPLQMHVGLCVQLRKELFQHFPLHLMLSSSWNLSPNSFKFFFFFGSFSNGTHASSVSSLFVLTLVNFSGFLWVFSMLFE